MRPLILKMSAFGPFAGEVTINFSEVADHGIFLISGNTGAGKTTIFDAVAFALYGVTSGDGRDAKSVRSDFAKPECETYVELEFVHKGKRYSVYRKPEQKRPRKRGGGDTIAPAEAYLRKPDESVVTKYKDVTDEIIEIIGIDYSQFKQIVMIAQGEFRKLLTADSNTRSDIFRRLFNTQGFERMQKRLNYRSVEAKQKCDDLRKSIDQYIAGIKYNHIKQENESIEIEGSALSVDGVLESLCDMNMRDEELYNKENKAYQEAEKKYEEFTKEYNSALKDNEDINKYKEVIKELDVFSRQKPGIDELKKQNEYSRYAVYEVAPFEEKVQSINLQINDYTSKIEMLNNQKETAEVKLKNARNNLKLWQEKQGETEAYAIKINLLETGLERYGQIKQLRNVQTQKASEIIDIEKVISAHEEGKQNLEKKIMELKTEIIDPYADSDLQKIKEEASADMLKIRVDKLNTLLADLEALAVLEVQFSNAEVYYKIAQTEYQTTAREYQRLDEIYYNSQVGMLVGRLRDNEPCPVCGSLNHPRPAVPSDEIITKEELDKAKDSKELLETKREKCLGNVREYEAKIKARREIIRKEILQMDEDIIKLSEETEPEKYTELTDIIKSNFKNAQDELKVTLENIKELTSRVRRREFALEQTEYIKLRLNDNLEQGQALLSEKRLKEDELREITSKIEVLCSQIGFSSEVEAQKKLDCIKAERANLISQYQKAVQEESEAQKALLTLNALIEKLVDDADSAKKKHATALAEYINIIEKYGFYDEEDYRKYLVTKTELEERERKVKDWEEQYSAILTQNNYYKERISGLEYKDLDNIIVNKNNADSARTNIRARINNINIILQNNKDIYKKLKVKGDEFEKAIKEYEIVNLLAKTANGDLSGREKVKFEQYVQGVYFKQILAEANKRLYKMSQGQYVLLKREEALDGRKHSGLEIDVFDYYTGKARNVASLSGGESFKAALSLALGLSDVIQSNNGGIDIDVMFIDEGFGSLDTDSLELAINVLQKLSDGERLIGIISHVAELKERIERQIVIEKTSSGSHITLIGESS